MQYKDIDLTISYEDLKEAIISYLKKKKFYIISEKTFDCENINLSQWSLRGHHLSVDVKFRGRISKWLVFKASAIKKILGVLRFLRSFV